MDSIDLVDHIVFKSRLLERLQGQLNARQSKALIRMLDTGPEGFEGGMSNENYMKITGASPATARRDLGGLVALKALTRTGERKSTRYWLRKPTGAPMIGTMPRQDGQSQNLHSPGQWDCTTMAKTMAAREYRWPNRAISTAGTPAGPD